MRFGNAQNRLSVMLLLTTIFFIVEIVVGYLTNSMALIADSFHMFSDAIALVIAFISVRMSPKKWSKNTFGWARAEILGALVNAVFLCALCFSILIESIKRFMKPDLIHEPHLILLVGGLGLLINLIGLLLFKDGGGHFHHHHHVPAHHHHHQHQLPIEENYLVCQGDSIKNINDVEVKHPTSSQMNMRGVFLHVMADALGSVIVMISALVVIYTDWSIRLYIDPILSVLMVCLILRSTWPLLTESAMILLQTVPTHIQVDSLRKRLTQEIQGVLAVHEFHVWQLAGDRIIASAHIRCHNLQDYMRIAEKVKEFFHNEGIHSTTIQPEFIDFENEVFDESNENCVLNCPTTQRTHCAPQTCCGAKKSTTSDSANIAISGTGEEQLVTMLTRRTTNVASEQKENTTESSMNQSLTGFSQDDNFEVISSGAAL